MSKKQAQLMLYNTPWYNAKLDIAANMSHFGWVTHFQVTSKYWFNGQCNEILLETWYVRSKFEVFLPCFCFNKLQSILSLPWTKPRDVCPLSRTSTSRWGLLQHSEGCTETIVRRIMELAISFTKGACHSVWRQCTCWNKWALSPAANFCAWHSIALL